MRAPEVQRGMRLAGFSGMKSDEIAMLARVLPEMTLEPTSQLVLQ
jgi:hypothetical protein